MSTIAKLFILIIFIISGCSKTSDERKIVAKVEEHNISLAAFVRSYIQKLQYSPVDVQDSPRLRKKHLDDMITRHFLAQEGKKAQLDTLLGFKKAMRAESTAVIIHGLYEKEVASEMEEISEEAVAEAFVKKHSRLHLCHLVSPTKSGIDSLYARLQNGETFKSLAKECFRDSTLKFTGGDLGFIEWGDLDIDFENAAYDLKIGEISKPVETKYGWHIIKLENIITNPIVRENEYQIRKKGVRERLRHRLLINRADLRIKKLMSEKHVQMNVPLIMLLEKERRKAKDEKLGNMLEAGEFFHPLSNLLERYRGENIATYDGGVWTVDDFLANLYTVSPAVRDAGVYRTVAMSLRNYFLLQIAEKKGIEKIERVRNIINEKREHLLSNIFLNVLADTLSFSEKDYLSYYEQIKRKQYSDREMQVLEIFVKSENKARKIVEELLKSNKDEKLFRKLARGNTIRPGMKAKEGYLGVVRKNDFGEIGRACMKLGKGGIMGPIKSNGGYSIVMLLDYQEIYTPFKHVKDDIASTLEQKKTTFLFENMKQKYTINSKIEINEDILMSF